LRLANWGAVKPGFGLGIWVWNETAWETYSLGPTDQGRQTAETGSWENLKEILLFSANFLRCP